MSAKEQCEKLMNEMLPVAEKMLTQFGEFYPYGDTLKRNGEIVHVSAKDSGTDRPKSKNLLEILKTSFRSLADSDQCKATAIVYDVSLPSLDQDDKSDAIQICLDHIENYSAEVFLPYCLTDGQAVYREMFAQEGKYKVFGSETNV